MWFPADGCSTSTCTNGHAFLQTAGLIGCRSRGFPAEGMARLLVEWTAEERVTLIPLTHTPDLAAQMRRRCQMRDGRLEENR